MDLYSEYIKSSEKLIVGKQIIQYKLSKRLGIEWPILASESPEAEEWRDLSTYAWGGIQPVDTGVLELPVSVSEVPTRPSPDDVSHCFQLSVIDFLVNNQISLHIMSFHCFFSIFPLVGSLFIPHFWVRPLFWAGVVYTGSFPRHTGSSLCV